MNRISRNVLRRASGVALVLCVSSAWSPAVRAQTPPKGPAASEIEVDPINCWWRTDKNAVTVGERFTLILTCGIVETDRNKVVVDPNQLDPSALSLSPFEIAGGSRHEDVLSPPWRYFQYEYTVRVIGNAVFGQDIDIPSITVKYTIVSSIGGNEGREQMYILPALTMRVLSLVPTKASDIRDATRDSFADMEARRRRSTEEMLAAAIAFGFAVVLLGLAVVGLFSRFRKRVPASARPLPAGSVLAACLGALRGVRSEVARDGWSPVLAARTLAALRIAAAVALGRTVAQVSATKNATVREGQIRLRQGLLRPRRALISASTSPSAIERQLAAATSGRRTQSFGAAVEDLRTAVNTFDATRYGRSDQLDTTSLDEAFDSATRAVRRLRVLNLWPLRVAGLGTLARTASMVVGAVAWMR